MPSWGSKPLPSDPAGLKAALQAGIPGPDSKTAKTFEKAPPGETYQQFYANTLMTEVFEVLSGAVPSGTRAAALQVLAGLPGVQVKPGATDPEGQIGTAVWVGRDSSGGHMLFDPATGAMLARLGVAQRETEGTPAGTVISYSTCHSFWTNRLPKFVDTKRNPAYPRNFKIDGRSVPPPPKG